MSRATGAESRVEQLSAPRETPLCDILPRKPERGIQWKKGVAAVGDPRFKSQEAD